MLTVATVPIDARQRFVAIGVTFTLTAVTLALIPVARAVLPPAPAAVPLLLGVALVTQLVTAYALMSQFLASRLVGTALLGGAYVVSALSMLVYVMTFPGVLPVAFGQQVAPWMWVAWHVEFPLAVCIALWLDGEKDGAGEGNRPTRPLRAIVCAAVLFVAVPALVVAVAGDGLPAIMRGAGDRPFWRTVLGEGLVLSNLAALGFAAARTRGRTVLDAWLLVALAAMCLDVQISLAGGARYTVGWYAGRVLVVLSSAAVLYAYLRQTDALFGRMRDLSMVDGLTALANRRNFESRLRDEVRAARRTGRPLAVAIADVDAFKQFNDAYGHLAGDAALRDVASALRVSVMRPGDLVARWGGEEFIAFFGETEREGAYQVAERLRGSVAGLRIPHRDTPVPGGVVTVSVGLATLAGRDDDADAMIARADAALYRAKNHGRNTVAVDLSPTRSDGVAPGSAS